MAFYDVHVCLVFSALVALSVTTVIETTDHKSVYEDVDILDGCQYPEYTSISSGAVVYLKIESKFFGLFCTLQMEIKPDYVPLYKYMYVKAEKMALANTSACLEISDGGTWPYKELGNFCGDSLFELNTSVAVLRIRLTTSSYTDEAAFRLVVTPFTKSCSSSHSSYFQCDNGDCISSKLVGDGHQNCQDNSDEKGVSGPPCPNDMFYCGSSSGLCIAASWRCDRFQDCPNSLDEENCVYKCPGSSLDGSSSHRYQCRDGSKCFDPYNRCTTDSYQDYMDDYSTCSDGSQNMDCDECDNGYTNGVSNGFSGYCTMTRSCVTTDKWCDGTNDCPDGGDEEYNLCQPSIYRYWSAGQLAGLFIGFIIFVGIVIVIVAIVHKKSSKQVV